MTGNVELGREHPAESGAAGAPAAPGRTPRGPLGSGGMPHVGSVRGGRLLVGAVALLVVGLLALLGYGLGRKQGNIPGLAINATGQIGRVPPGPAPDFVLQRYDGGTVRLSEQRGKVVVVNYWASWCPPCRLEAPALERVWRRYQGRGVLLIGLDIWDTERDARAFIREFGLSYPNGPDPGGTTAIDYGLTGLPETFFIRRDGTIARHWIGPLTDEQLAALIEEAAR